MKKILKIAKQEFYKLTKKLFLVKLGRLQICGVKLLII